MVRFCPQPTTSMRKITHLHEGEAADAELKGSRRTVCPMEANWQRRVELPALDRGALEGALRAAGVTAGLRTYTPLPGGLVNLNVAVALTTSPSAAVFRVYLRDREAAAKEAALLAHVRGLVRAPEVLAKGELELPVAGEPAERPWLLLSWVPGRALSEALGALDEDGLGRAGSSVGGALARLHGCARPELGFLDASLDVPSPMGSLRETWRHYLGGLLREGPAVERLDATRRRALQDYVLQHADELEPLEGRWSLLHADCKPTNVFVDDSGALTGLLDWEFAWSGPPLFDLGQMLRTPLPATYEAALLESYRKAGGLLPAGWRHAAHLLDLMNLVGFLAQEGTGTRQTQDVLGLLDAYV